MFHSGEPAADVEFCLVLPSESLSVPVMRRVLGDTLDRLGLDEACIGDLLLAVTEACTNVLRHAGAGRRYELVAHVGSTRCLLEVVDSGRGFDPASVSRRRNGIALRHPVRPVVPRLGRRPQVSSAPAAAATGPSAAAAGSTGPGTAGPGSPPVLRSRIIRARRTARQRVLADLAESGRGLAIMRACVDDVTMRSSPGLGTIVSLRKRIEWRSDAPLPLRPASPLRDAG